MFGGSLGGRESCQKEFNVSREGVRVAKSKRGGGRGDKDTRSDFIDRTVKIKRCAAVIKGGRRFSFAAMVVVGDGKGRVGWGYGKANEVPPSVEKAQKQAQRRMVKATVQEGTIPHSVKGRFGAAEVLLIPARPGTGVIAGAAVRAVCEAAGITDILTKSYGSNNPVTLVKACFNALEQLRTAQDIERLRGVSIS